MNRSDVHVGDVVQIDPAHDERFGACLMFVEEVKNWGVQGYVQIPAGGRAYYRCPWEGMEMVGRAFWLPADVAEKVGSEAEAGDELA